MESLCGTRGHDSTIIEQACVIVEKAKAAIGRVCRADDQKDKQRHGFPMPSVVPRPRSKRTAQGGRHASGAPRVRGDGTGFRVVIGRDRQSIE
jgi:hypothetical protein